MGALLRTWRERRRYSQQELSDRSGVSTRHLSRVETGKARPTPEMLVHLSENLDLPLRERNRLLLAGGYAPRYRDRHLTDASSAAVMDGLRALLDAHRPYPALLLDEYWDIVDANAAVDRLLTGCAPALLEPPVNVVRLALHPDGLAGRIADPAEWGGHLLRQIDHRAERTHDARHHALAAEIAGYLEAVPGGRSGDGDASRGAAAPAGPVLSLDLTLDGTPLRFFSTSATLTTATDAALAGLHLETFLPVDGTTRRWLETPAGEGV
ncbi:putative DNA-binding protein [Streptomyces sp. Tu6071]|uniref:helix-turn-helix domain-containing protein n=1 Tax=unclassified Streptomyces TaxID=2593676 RepID=UPI00020E5747|nr:transcriptional regulator [Streptomyces sp. CLI2509]EGJ75217.1 putative DNA-binding protein [Streptomyces sp. Tu6071]MYX18704.1 helix-turn-helix domain-containing protein [Streptomyces sp. SID8380]